MLCAQEGGLTEKRGKRWPVGGSIFLSGFSSFTFGNGGQVCILFRNGIRKKNQDLYLNLKSGLENMAVLEQIEMELDKKFYV